ncbi:MAG TPA: molybdenum cofactor biosynthesis protein MoaE [Jatrophihabitans sp.]|jgi:molybdopterin synthase catalytic subunit
MQGALGVVTDRPLDVPAHLQAVSVPAAGGHVLFCGVIRDHDHDRAVREIEYLAHPSAQDVLHEVVADFAARPEVLVVTASHRVGPLVIGDVALVAAISSVHRGPAFELCGELVDELKARLPIWKRQIFTDGSDEWVNCP